MRISKVIITGVSLLLFNVSYEQDGTNSSENKNISEGRTYGYDAEFLKQHTRKVLELHDKDNRAKILLSADYQGRVMTSTATGDSGTSYGWLNYNLISSGEKKK